MLFNRRTIPNAWCALSRSVRQFFHGSLMAPDPIISVRLDICRQCVFLHKRTGQCRLCTCYVGLKTLLSAERCPRGYWHEYFSRRRHRWLHNLRALARKLWKS